MIKLHMSQLPSLCCDYPPNVMITLQMSGLPPNAKCHNYPQMSQLPSKFHDYPPNFMITLQISWLHSSCHDYPPNVMIILLLSQLPSKCHPTHEKNFIVWNWFGTKKNECGKWPLLTPSPPPYYEIFHNFFIFFLNPSLMNIFVHSTGDNLACSRAP